VLISDSNVVAANLSAVQRVLAADVWAEAEVELGHTNAADG